MNLSEFSIVIDLPNNMTDRQLNMCDNLMNTATMKCPKCDKDSNLGSFYNDYAKVHKLHNDCYNCRRKNLYRTLNARNAKMMKRLYGVKS